MKSFINRLSSVWVTISGPVNKISQNQKRLPYVLIMTGAVSLSSCFLHYYKTNSVDRTDAATLQKLVNGGKYFILHSNHQDFALAQVKVNNENLEGEINPLPPEHQEYLHPEKEFANKFPGRNKQVVLYEVHLYTQDSVGYNPHISLPVKHFYKLDVYELDQAATRRSRVSSIIGLSLTTVGIVAIIAAIASAGNDEPTYTGTGGTWDLGCSPQVYALNGSSSELAGIFYSGAIFAPLQRTDYLPLSDIEPVNDRFRLQIRGGKNEELFIHENKLLQVTHSKDNEVLPDRNGKVLVFRHPVKPGRVFIDENQDMRDDLLAKDGRYYSFTNHSKNDNASDVILDFKKPAGINSGKLLVRARNSSWAVYLFKKYKSFYGDYYATMLQQKDKAAREKLLQCELDQSLPLSVSVKAGNNWKFVDYFFTPGNEVSRDMIMEINLADFKNNDHIQIKLETTYMFWDLDYVGMDFSENLTCKTTYLEADRIAKSGSNSLLKEPDPIGNNTHLAATEQLNLDFTVQSATTPNLVNSYFLVGSGYYHDNTRFEGKPQLGRLATFSQKGAFDKFSRQTFGELLSLIKNSAPDAITTNN